MANRYKLRVVLGETPKGKIWRDIGIATVDEKKKKISVKLDLLPVGDFDGWISGFLMESDEDIPY